MASPGNSPGLCAMTLKSLGHGHVSPPSEESDSSEWGINIFIVAALCGNSKLTLCEASTQSASVALCDRVACPLRTGKLASPPSEGASH